LELRSLMFTNKDTTKTLIEHVISRFLKTDMKYTAEQFESFKDILQLPVTALKDVDKMEALQLKELFSVNSIDDLSKLDPVNPENAIVPDPKNFPDTAKYTKQLKVVMDNLAEAFPDYEILRKHIAMAGMIKRSWQKRAAYTKKKETKVICVGLDNAGKTAILTGLGGKLGITELGKLKPTKRIERRKVATDKLDLYVWDFGGQEDYRKDYLSKPEAYFLGSDLLIYVVDMQDPNRYNESFEYLIEVLDIMKLLGENPYVLAFMHKSDPDILDDPDFQLSTEYVADKLNYLLNNYDFEFDIYTTSIYNFFTSEPKFSRFIKETLSDKESLNNPVVRKIEGLGDIMDSTLNAIVTLASSLNEQIAQLAVRIEELEKKTDREYMPLPQTNAEKRSEIVAQQAAGPNIPEAIKKGLNPPQGGKQIIYQKPLAGLNAPPGAQTANPEVADSRLTILNELSSLFQAKKSLDNSTQLSKLGALGKKFEKTKKSTSNKKKLDELNTEKESEE
jgi:GTPase SAR1 family protein